MPRHSDPPADDVAVDELVTMSHPALPGETSVQPRASFPAWAEVGWVEHKSPASADAKSKPSPEGDATLEKAGPK